MADYYCNVAGTYATAQDGTDNSGSEWQGPYGLQKAFDTVTVANRCFVKGTGNLTRLVKIVCDADVGAAGWVAGDSVRNDTGDGDDWTGIICEVATTDLIVELTIGDDQDDINNTDGIENTTQVDTAGISSNEAQPINIDTNTGSTSTGYVKFIGVNDSWTVDGTRAKLDANSDATFCIYASGTIHYIWLENWECTNALTGGAATAGNNDYWVWSNTIFHSNSGYGIDLNLQSGHLFVKCQSYNNSGTGMVDVVGATCVLCTVYGNSDDGIQGGWIYRCIIHDNGGVSDYGMYQPSGCYYNVIDGHAGTGVYIPARLFFNRITNNATGLDFNNQTTLSGWNYFHDNTVDLVNPSAWSAVGNDAAYICDENETNTNLSDVDSDDGYQNRASYDFNLKIQRTYNGDGSDTIGLNIPIDS